MKKVFLFVFLLTKLVPAFSQNYGEVGIFIGGSYFFGDVHSTIPEDVGFSGGLDYRYNFSPRWAWRTDFKYSKISGDDSQSRNDFEIQRNLSFSSDVFQLNTYVEFNFLTFKPYNPQSFFQDADVFTPFVFVGIGLMYHNPKAFLSGNEYELQPLQTEGVSYSKIGVVLPFGFGFKFRLSDRFILGLYGELAPTFTDYLDDVSDRYPIDPSSLSKTGRDLSNRALEAQGPNNSSWGTQRGSDYNKDWLSSVVFSINFNLKKNPSSCHFNPNK